MGDMSNIGVIGLMIRVIGLAIRVDHSYVAVWPDPLGAA